MPTNSMNRVIEHLRRAVLHHDAPSLTDGQLLDSFIEMRDEGAMEALVRRHGPMVLGVCRRVLRNEHDAEDAFQATFLVLVRKATSIKPRQLVGNWLYGVAYHTAVRAKVAAAKRQARERQLISMPEPKAAQERLAHDALPFLDQELAGLPVKYRYPIVLCDLEGKTYKQAAAQLGCSEGTLSSRLTRARGMLAKRLTRRGVTVSAAGMAVLLSQNAASAGVSSSLVASTMKLTTCATASAGVLALAEGVLKTMLLTKLKAMLVVLLVSTVVGVSWLVVPARSRESGPPTEPQPQKAEVSVDNANRTVKIPGQVEGILLFIGTTIKEGDYTSPQDIVNVLLGGKMAKFRRLKVGDQVGEGQLLGRLDDRLARTELAIKESKLTASKADFSGAAAISEEAENKLKTAVALYERKAISLEDLRSAELTRTKLAGNVPPKKAGVDLAEKEVLQAQIMIDLHELRSPIIGVITKIHIQPGEAVRKFDTVMEITAKGR